jgi:hypothetical protein
MRWGGGFWGRNVRAYTLATCGDVPLLNPQSSALVAVGTSPAIRYLWENQHTGGGVQTATATLCAQIHGCVVDTD